MGFVQGHDKRVQVLRLWPVAFGSWWTHGNKTWLHPHLGEGYAGNWAINKSRYLCWGMRFSWGTNCYDLEFVLSYNGTDPTFVCLQMCLVCWDMDIIHQNVNSLIDADYWSRLGTDLCFNPLLRDYI